MQLTNIFISALLAMAVSAADGDKKDGGNKGGNSVKKECFKMAQLEMVTKLGANDTALANKFHNNQTAVDAFKAKVADAGTKLKEMQANTTLVGECATINAEAKEKAACGQMKFAEKMVELAGNDTALAAKFKNNQTKIDNFKTKATSVKAELTTMQNNATLTSFCSVLTTQSECRKMAKLTKQSEMAKNQTELEAKFKGDETKIKAFQAKATKWDDELKTMMANTTLMDACKNMKEASGMNNGKATDKDNKKSAATTLDAFSGFVTAAFVLAVSGAVML